MFELILVALFFASSLANQSSSISPHTLVANFNQAKTMPVFKLSGGHHSGGDHKDKNNHNEHNNDNNHEQKPEHEDEHESHYYVGTVTANDGQKLISGSATLSGESPWLPILMVGVWFEAYGHWSNGSFIATEIEPIDSEKWLYFSGPAEVLGWKIADDKNIETWIKSDGSIESIRDTKPSSEKTRIVAFYDGKDFVAFPSILSNPPKPQSTGWFELLGDFSNGEFSWVSSKKFP